MSKYTPLPHQGEALKDILNHPNGLLNQDRTQYISACGTGKTLVLLWSAEQYLQTLTPNKEISNTVTVFLFPSLTLINQSYDSYKQHNSIPGYTPMVVCSDDKVGAQEEEEDTAENCLFDVSTDPIQIQNYLDNKTISNKVIFSTYKSAPLVGEALKNTRTTADITIFDEAHRTAVFNANSSGRTQTVKHNSGYALDNDNFPSKKRLFATATPRMYTFRDNFYEMNPIDKGDVAYSMDNPLLFGRIAHEYSMRQAIQEGIITDYKILAIAVNEQDVLRFLKPRMVQNDLNKITQDQRVLEEVAKMLAIKNAYDKYGIKNAIVFNSTIEGSKAFINNFSTLIDNTITTSHVDGSMNNEQRNTHIDILRAPGKALLSNAKLLSEGHDVPEADFVVFNNKTESKTDIVQRVGRVQRRDKNNPDKIGYILLPIFVNDVNQDIEESLTNEGLRTLFSTVAALKESDTQLRDWIATRKRIREASLFNDSETPTDNSNESKIIFTDVFTLQNEQDQKAQQDNTGTSIPQSQTKETQAPISSPSATTSDVIAQFNNEQYANLMKQWENRIEAVIVGEKESFEQWILKCKVYKEYTELFGLKINTAARENYKGVNLGSWLGCQIDRYEKNLLSEFQVNMLLEINSNFYRMKDFLHDSLWEEAFVLIEKYIVNNNRLPPEQYFEDGRNLYAWMIRQRQNNDQGTLREDRKQKLLSLPCNILLRQKDSFENAWSKKYDLVKKYLSLYGAFPSANVKFEGEAIGVWVKDQRRRSFRLNEEKINLLLALDNTFFSKDFFSKNTDSLRLKQNERKYLSLERYYRLNGVLPKEDYRDESGFALGKWLGDQKRRYKNNKLAQHQIDRLIAIDPTIFQNQTPASGISDFLSTNTPKSHQDLG